MSWWTLVGGATGRTLDHLKEACPWSRFWDPEHFLSLSLLLCSLRLTLYPSTYFVPWHFVLMILCSATGSKTKKSTDHGLKLRQNRSFLLIAVYFWNFAAVMEKRTYPPNLFCVSICCIDTYLKKLVCYCPKLQHFSFVFHLRNACNR